MTTATERALGIPELLKAILLQLPPCDLLFIQRVSTTFKDVICKSIKIQQKLFRQTQPMYADGISVLNPFILRILRHHGIIDFEALMNVSGKDGECIELEGDDAYTTSGDLRQFRTHDIITFNVGGAAVENCFEPMIKVPSYESMLIADPPMEIRYFCLWRGGYNLNLKEGGITTMRDVLDAFEDSFPWFSRERLGGRGPSEGNGSDVYESSEGEESDE